MTGTQPSGFGTNRCHNRPKEAKKPDTTFCILACSPTYITRLMHGPKKIKFLLKQCGHDVPLQVYPRACSWLAALDKSKQPPLLEYRSIIPSTARLSHIFSPSHLKPFIQRCIFLFFYIFFFLPCLLTAVCGSKGGIADRATRCCTTKNLGRSDVGLGSQKITGAELDLDDWQLTW